LCENNSGLSFFTQEVIGRGTFHVSLWPSILRNREATQKEITRANKDEY